MKTSRPPRIAVRFPPDRGRRRALVHPAGALAAAGVSWGRVAMRGARALRHEAAIRRRVLAVAWRAPFMRPERHLLSIERRGGEIEILTTSHKLAHRIVRALVATFGGCCAYAWSKSDGALLATWTWGDESRLAGPRGRPVAVKGRPGLRAAKPGSRPRSARRGPRAGGAVAR